MRVARINLANVATSAYAALLVLCLATQCVYAESWTQKSVEKEITLGGAVSQLRMDIVATPRNEATDVEDGDVVPYIFYLSAQEHKSHSLLRASMAPPGKKAQPVEVRTGGLMPGDRTTAFYEAMIPREYALGTDELQIFITSAMLHTSTPLPATAPQGKPQHLVWKGDAALRTPYHTGNALINVRVPYPTIVAFAPQSIATRTGKTITYGPYIDVAPSAKMPIAEAMVHYEYLQPVVSYVDFARHVEVSHWGNNLATEDTIALKNDGAKLEDTFNRARHMYNNFVEGGSDAVNQIRSIPIVLPANADDVYYVDAMGNVSTSSMPPKVAGHKKPRRMEIFPRYPVLGGWNYTFSVGWNLNLEGNGIARRVTGAPHRVRIGVPFLMAPSNVAIDHASLRIVLPEGAQHVEVHTPFSMDLVHIGPFPTYLDTVPRRAVLLERAKCTSKMNGIVFVDYTLYPSAHWRKPLAVGTAAFAIFIVSVLSRRVL
ncbi:dolichyl-diphosphooligosaccharide--protein glycosyltransferase subunit 1 [Malassezia vespertilionis]|uniref:Dolichyl-diphosphooligosaccharide--protein glycosyltransferase subunit 1 n=1 Tax=Malassezia vespertilionis TaxID=2020962 RepID=A0A2N1JBB4_9BASI|nr:dolichyl-diphosphooligosaccharide--protein glycosyltransferase subunit 1 [Malassezia vespertilionis]PKI83839.1 Ost1p [Malassezia vespertilionis]WFD06642.1 dolichyl-diphosphooligosaccharide--protein glycosyltransferase subunit 1 [Malassezia vespertilionis]